MIVWAYHHRCIVAGLRYIGHTKATKLARTFQLCAFLDASEYLSQLQPFGEQLACMRQQSPYARSTCHSWEPLWAAVVLEQDEQRLPMHEQLPRGF